MEQSTLLLETSVSHMALTPGPDPEYHPSKSHPPSEQIYCSEVDLLKMLTNLLIRLCVRVMGKLVASFEAVPFA